MQVRAKKIGYHDLKRRREGDVFDVKHGFKLGSWMEELDANGKPKAKAEAKAKADAKPEPKAKAEAKAPKSESEDI